MPPCRRCLAALITAGVTRIVTRKSCLGPIVDGANKNGIELVTFRKVQEQMARINTLFYGNPEGKKREFLTTDSFSGNKRQKSC